MQLECLSPIGGYFELERPANRTALPAHALRYQSARAALRALLEFGRPRRLWLPAYVCDAVALAARAAGTPVQFYALAPDLGVPSTVTPEPGEWLLYVNYFGLCSAQAAALLARVRPDQIILDHAQAYFEAPADCLATLYSPRKFFGLPDGGLLHTCLNIPPPAEQDQQSIQRTLHLLKRCALDAESGYADFQCAEAQLSDSQPRQMSTLTERLLEDVDCATAQRIRRANFATLHHALGADNTMPLSLNDAAPALCYPYLTNDSTARERLLRARVYVPRYWPNALTRVSAKGIEHGLIDYCLPLPIDQRYDIHAMQRIIAVVQAKTAI